MADAVEADRFLKRFAVVLGAGVDDRDAVDEFTERDAAAVVADPQHAFVELDLDFFARAHREFVDAVVDRLLEQDVDAVAGIALIENDVATSIFKGCERMLDGPV